VKKQRSISCIKVDTEGLKKYADKNQYFCYSIVKSLLQFVLLSVFIKMLYLLYMSVS